MFTQNLKGFSNLAGKVTGIFKKGDAKEGQAEGQGQGQDEEFTHVMDQALMTACTRAYQSTEPGENNTQYLTISTNKFHCNSQLLTSLNSSKSSWIHWLSNTFLMLFNRLK